ncbi:MAG TPA: dTDP-glucose 4,6-dehydratase [Verrucomicrobiota bacterium]|nr:dTDP-glucose 4,6-dehydratase [Verrucomicrobiota bacterium]
MKLIVTGGAGFIGSEFVRQAVRKNNAVVVVDKLSYAGDLARLKEVQDSIRFYKADITDRDAIKQIFAKEKPEAVVHFAAESHVDRSILNADEFLTTNLIGTHTLLDCAKEFQVGRFVNISTDEVYGELGEEGQFCEESPLNPNSPYSVSKASADMLGRAYFRTYQLPVITIRPSNNYGPWQYPEKLLPVVIVKALKNEPIPVYGKGANVREWFYVTDCANAVLTILEKGKDGEVYNISSGEERKNIDVVKTILSLLGKDEGLITFVKDRPGHDFRYAMNSSKVKRECGWKPVVGFDEGIRKTVEWYLRHQDWLFDKIKDLEGYWKKVYKV